MKFLYRTIFSRKYTFTHTHTHCVSHLFNLSIVTFFFSFELFVTECHSVTHVTLSHSVTHFMCVTLVIYVTHAKNIFDMCQWTSIVSKEAF
jgi:hypothetical protein